MAAVTQLGDANVYGHETVRGPERVGTSSLMWFTCRISINFTGTYADADGFTFDAATAIENALRSGADVTIRDAMMAAPGMETISSVVTTVGADEVAVSTDNVVGKLNINDFSTAHADAVLGTFEDPIIFAVTYTQT